MLLSSSPRFESVSFYVSHSTWKKCFCVLYLKDAGTITGEGMDFVSAGLDCYLKWESFQRYMTATDLLSPGLSLQKFLAQALEPSSRGEANRCQNVEVSITAAKRTWAILTQYSLPLLKRFGSAAHLNGIQVLGLDTPMRPSFEDLSRRLSAHSEWKLIEAQGELAPEEFFQLLSQRIFPIVMKLRSIDSVFCGYEPDLWHEAVGHVALLLDPDIAAFYKFCGDLMLSLDQFENAGLRADLGKILWILLEYGLIREDGNVKVFGAAFASSYVALQRFRLGYTRLIKFSPEKALLSGLADDGKLKQTIDKIPVMYIPSLDNAKHMISKWVSKRRRSADLFRHAN
jgi:phenylalanine-4-hydroxylase